MSVPYEGFRKNRQPEEVEETNIALYRDRDFIALCTLASGTIFLATGIGFAFGLPWAAVTLGLILLIVGFVLEMNKDN